MTNAPLIANDKTDTEDPRLLWEGLGAGAELEPGPDPFSGTAAWTGAVTKKKNLVDDSQTLKHT